MQLETTTQRPFGGSVLDALPDELQSGPFMVWMGSYLDLNPLPGVRSKFKLPGETDALYWGIIDVQMSLQAIIKKYTSLYVNCTLI